MRQPSLFFCFYIRVLLPAVFVGGHFCYPEINPRIRAENHAGMLTRKVGTGAPDELVRLPDLMVLTICPSSE